MVNVFGREGELLAVVDPRLPPAAYDPRRERRWPRPRSTGREAERHRALRGGRARAGRRPRARTPTGTVRGAVVVVELPAAERWPRRPARSRSATRSSGKAESFREPIKAVYLSLYLFPALLILFGAVWLSLYLARRITTPLRLVAEGAERIAAGERGVKVDFPAGSDEFTALIASFNRMSERLARSEEEVEFSRRRPHPQEPGAGGAAPAHGDGAGDGGHGRRGGGQRGHDHRHQRRRLPPPRRGRRPPWAARWPTPCAGPGREEILELTRAAPLRAGGRARSAR